MKILLWSIDVTMFVACVVAITWDLATVGTWNIWAFNCMIWVAIARMRQYTKE
jgi:hypothetical protein